MEAITKDPVSAAVPDVALDENDNENEKPQAILGELETLHVDGVDPVFEAQAELINHAVQSMGMGKVSLLLPFSF
jgi:hypothetical protein